MNKLRRNLLLLGGTSAAGLYVNNRGLRYPRMGLAPNPPSSHGDFQFAHVALKDSLFTDLNVSDEADFDSAEIDCSVRAYTPSPIIEITPASNKCTLLVNNISPDSQLAINADSNLDIVESVHAINRVITIKHSANKKIRLEWLSPYSEAARFAVIGDTGGGDELNWCIQRASELNAQFLFHLGDFNYSKGEYQKAISAFHNAPLPIYVSIGNHDFNDKGLVYPHFLDQIGPLNTSFTVASTRLINLDTAASFFPSYSGNRGRMIKELLTDDLNSQEKAVLDSVVLTHKPFVDTRTHGDHTMSGVNEQQWFLNSMRALEAKTMICGHVHRSTSIEHQGITQITAGEGLGFEDIRHQRTSAQILIGEVSRGVRFNHHWRDLNMPWEAHTSPTHYEKLRRPELQKQQEWFNKLSLSFT